MILRLVRDQADLVLALDVPADVVVLLHGVLDPTPNSVDALKKTPREAFEKITSVPFI